ncbi:MAG: YggT family protein [Alphaproteobacteria bacterium]
MTEILYIIYRVLGLISWVLFAKVIVDVLVMGRIIPYNDTMGKIMQVLHQLTEPILGRIRGMLPPAPIDISYIVAIFGIWILRMFIATII